MVVKTGYPGSKAGAGVWQRIISLMPEHRNYFELFLGHGAVMQRKKPAPGFNVGCDVDAGVIEWWRRRPRRAPSPRLTVLEADALHLLSSHPAMEDPRTLAYLDPPYLRSTRTRRIYDHEFCSEEDHRLLLKILNSLPCKVMISGYPSELYETQLPEPRWRCLVYRTMTRGGWRWEALGRDLEWVIRSFREARDADGRRLFA